MSLVIRLIDGRKEVLTRSLEIMIKLKNKI